MDAGEGGVEFELTALREQRAKARKEREQLAKRRRLLLNKTLEPEIIDTIPELKTVILQEPDTSLTKKQSSNETKSLDGIQVDISGHNGTGKSTPKSGFESNEQTDKSKLTNNNTTKGKYKEKREKQNSTIVTTVSAFKNDYSQHFVDTKQRPQNFIRDSDLADRFEEYPKLRELIQLKDNLVQDHSTPLMYKKVDLKSCDLAATLGTKFDVILVDPPWEEYSRRDPTLSLTSSNPFWTLDEMMDLQIDQISESPSFLWLWVGSSEGLDQGRLLLKKWGFRRCEDICWLKTNKNGQQNTYKDPWGIFHHTKEHCIMGIKGTVRRNQDSHVIHANIDTDIIISEEPPLGSTEKPVELYHIIEHFSLGRRRLELFGRDHNIRPGWVTLDISHSNYSPSVYKSYFAGEPGHLLPSTAEIESLRPKSPTRGPRPPPPLSSHRPHRSAHSSHSSHSHPHYPTPSPDPRHSPSPSYNQPYPRAPRQSPSHTLPYKPKDNHPYQRHHDPHHSRGHGYHPNDHHDHANHSGSGRSGYGAHHPSSRPSPHSSHPHPPHPHPHPHPHPPHASRHLSHPPSHQPPTGSHRSHHYPSY